MRAIYTASSLAAFVLVCGAQASVVLDNLTNSSGTGMYQSQAGIAGMVDDLELDGLLGFGPNAGTMITQVQAAFNFTGSAALPLGFRVNVFSFDPNSIAGSANGNVYSQVFLRSSGLATLQPYPTGSTADGSYSAGSFLLNIDLAGAGPMLAPGPYYFSIVAEGVAPGTEAFVFGSNLATVGTVDNALQAFYGNPPPFAVTQTNTNAAYRVFTNFVPTPGTALIFGLASMVVAPRRRRA